MSVFTDNVVKTMLEIIREMDCLKMIDGSKVRNQEVYAKIADKINEHFKYEGSSSKITGSQINTKWKSMKKTYREEKQKSDKSGNNNNNN